MNTFALIDTKTGIIVNRIVLDDISKYDVPADMTIVQDETLEIGGSYSGGVYAAPVSSDEVAVARAPMSVVEKLAKLGIDFDELRGAILNGK